jgi:uncharacterized membrane protein
VLSVLTFVAAGVAYAYTPGSWDLSVMERIDTAVASISDTGGKERLGYVITILMDRAEDIEDERSRYLLEYTMRRIDAVMQQEYGF